jgi:hypothetical protein
LAAKLKKSAIYDGAKYSFEYRNYMVYVFSSFPTIIVSEKGNGEAFHFPFVVIDEIAKTFEEAVENAKFFIDNPISETTVSSVSSD